MLDKLYRFDITWCFRHL